MRTTDTGEEVLGFVGYVDRVEPTGNQLDVSVNGPAGLLEDRPLRFTPPGIQHGSTAEAFESQWRILDYVFELPDPRSFPPFTEAIAEADAETVRRFIATTRDLAASTILSIRCVEAVDRGAGALTRAMPAECRSVWAPQPRAAGRAARLDGQALHRRWGSRTLRARP